MYFACKSVLFFFLVLINLWISYGTAGSVFKAESIVGGYQARQYNFQYQAEILGLRNGSNISYSICGAGLIANFFSLSAAHCFLQANGTLKDYSFIVAAGTDYLESLQGLRIKVHLIYLGYIDISYSQSDIAVVKTKYGFGIYTQPNLNVLQLPEPDELPESNFGIFTGFGFNWIDTINLPNGTQRIVKGNTDLKLYYGVMRILERETCIAQINDQKQLCAMMLPILPQSKAGTCLGDSGGPLVVNNKLIGIQSLSSVFCDDRYIPGIYTKVSYFTNFIRPILNGEPLSNTVIFRNRPHIMPALFEGYNFWNK